MSIDIYSAAGLEELLVGLGQPRFRAVQLLEWLYGKGIRAYDEATNLPRDLRALLEQEAPLYPLKVKSKRVSADGTRKYLLELKDGELVEAVGIPSRETGGEDGAGRLTVCFSTQVGCAMACAFCATGTEGFTRNLSCGEMVQQVQLVAQDFQMRASGAVAMGQGEPFLNFDNTVAALQLLNHPKAAGIGARHLTVSTCGIADGIRAFGDVEEQFVLAVSLHSARQEVRDVLMPKMAGIPLEELKAALLDYQARARRRVSFEYLLIDGVNSAPADLDALVAFCQGLSAHVNILPVNPVEGSAFKPADEKLVGSWVEALRRAGVEASVRASRGADIDGACGQLKNRA